MIAAITNLLASSEPYTAADWVTIIGAIGALITSATASVAACVIAIRNGRKADAVHTRVDEVHECLHRQADDVKQIIATQHDLEEPT